jgi:hypothetical protein
MSYRERDIGRDIEAELEELIPRARVPLRAAGRDRREEL